MVTTPVLGFKSPGYHLPDTPLCISQRAPELPLGKLSRGRGQRVGSPGATLHPFCTRPLSVCLHMYICTPKWRSQDTCVRIIMSAWEACVFNQMPSLPEALAGCQLGPAGSQWKHTSSPQGKAIREQRWDACIFPLSPAWHARTSCSWWHIRGGRMRVVGVLYEALWEPVFALSGGRHLNADQRSWRRLLAWREVVILFPFALFPSHACTVAHLSFLLLISFAETIWPGLH